MLETEEGQGGSRVVFDKFVVESAGCSHFVWMNEVEKGLAKELFMIPTEQLFDALGNVDRNCLVKGVDHEDVIR